jgi:hypothetical protein
VAVICCCALALAVAGPSITAAYQWPGSVDSVELSRQLQGSRQGAGTSALSLTRRCEGTGSHCSGGGIVVVREGHHWCVRMSAAGFARHTQRRIVRKPPAKGTTSQIKWLVSGNERPRTSSSQRVRSPHLCKALVDRLRISLLQHHQQCAVYLFTQCLHGVAFTTTIQLQLVEQIFVIVAVGAIFEDGCGTLQ